MARQGSTSIANRLSRAGAVITGTPFTFAAWYKAITLPSVDANAGHAILTITDTARDDNFFGLFGRAADDLFRFSAQAPGLPLRSAVSTTAITAGQWFHVCGVSASTTDRRIYIDGVEEGQSTVSTIPAGLDQTQMFATRISSGNFSPANAHLAEGGVWNVALTADQVATLATPGILPSDVRPLSLKMYLDLMLALSPEPDRSSNGNALFVTGSLPQSDHVPAIPALSLLTAARWVINPVVQVGGAFVPKVSTLIDPARVGPGGEIKHFKHSSVIDPAVSWCLSYVVGADLTPLDGDPEIENLFEEDEPQLMTPVLPPPSPPSVVARRTSHRSYLNSTPDSCGWDAAKMDRALQRMSDKGTEVSALTSSSPMHVCLRQLARAVLPQFPDRGAFDTWVL